MSRLEDLLRTALAETPTPPTRGADPLPAVERRVGRARLALGSAALAGVLAVAAAVVVPLQLTGSDGRPAGVAVSPGPSSSPTPTPTVTARPPAELLWATGAQDVAVAGGTGWVLAADGRGGEVVARPDGTARFAVPPDATRLGAAGSLVWAWGGRHVAAVDPQRGAVASFDAGAEVKGVGLAAGSAWVSVPDRVLRLEASGASLRQVSATPVTGSGGPVTVTDSGQVWVQTDTSLVQVVPDAGGAHAASPVHWPAPLLGPAGGDQVWTYDGRLVALTPRLLQVGTSVAEGARVPVPGTPTAVATAPDGSLYVAVGGTTPGIYHYSADPARRDVLPTGTLPGRAATAVAADGSGAVLFVTPEGTLERWTPSG